MAGYLQRLASRSGPPAGGGMSPFVRTRSPIASLDQRFGLPGFEEVGLRRSDRALAPDRAPRPVWDLSSEEPTLRSPEAEAAPGENGGPAPAELRREEGPETTTTAGQTRRPRDAGSPATAEEPGRASAVRHVLEAAAQERDSESGVSRRARSPVLEDAVFEGASARPPVPAEASPPVGGSPAHLTPSVPPPPVSGRRPGAAASRPTGEADRRPRLEIGAIQVEVVPPPPEVASPPPPRRATAESISQIGPLGPRRRSNLRFALRQR